MGPLLPLKPRLVLLGLAIVLPLGIPSSNAAPVQSDGKTSREKGCYFMQKYYNSGENIDTGERCLNCTCKENTLMCYLRVCPFVKPLGEDCIEEHMPSECCPKFWCPEVYPRVSTEKPEEEDTGCYIDGKYYQEGARIPSNPLKACEVCYCIRNSSVCTMQQCELKVEGCSPQFRTGSCCPSRYNCSHLAATTLPPGILEELGDEGGCVHNGKRFADGEQVDSDDKCTHCYCMKHEVVCAVEKCKAPGEGCMPVPPEDGQCCPQRYECPTTAIPTFHPTTESILQDASASISSTMPDASTSTTASIAKMPTKIGSALSKEAKKAPEPVKLTTVVKDDQTSVSREISVTTEKTFTVTGDGLQTLVPQGPRVPKITEHPTISTVLARNVTKRPVFFPGHIPGEGVCRNLNLTYLNGQAVPSNDPCRTNCSCSSSVIHCDAVECTLIRPPGFTSCKTVRNKDGCCPRFECYTDNDTTLAGLTQTRFDATMTTTRVSIAEDTVLEQVQFPMTEQLDFGGISSTIAAEVKIKFTTSGMITTTISVPDSKESSTHMSIPTDVAFQQQDIAFQQQDIESDDTFIDVNSNISFKEKTTTESLKKFEMVETTSAVTGETTMPNITRDVEFFMTTTAKPVDASVTYTSLSDEITPKETEQPEISISDQESTTQTSITSAEITSSSIMEASEDTSETTIPHVMKSTSKPAVTERVETKLSTFKTEPSMDISSTTAKPVDASVTYTSLSDEITPKETEQPEISVSDQESTTQTSTTSAEITSSSIMEASEDTSETTIPHVMKSTSKPAVTERVETKLSTLKTEPSRDILSTMAKPVDASVTYTSLSDEITPKETEQPEISVSDQESTTQTSTTSAEITSSSIMEASEDTSETTIPHVMKSTSKPAVTERVETKLSTFKTEPSRDISSTTAKPVDASVTYTSLSDEITPKETEQPEISVSDQESTTQTSTTSAEITSSSIMEASEDTSETTIPHVMKSTSKPAVTERVETKLSTLKTEPSRDISSTMAKPWDASVTYTSLSDEITPKETEQPEISVSDQESTTQTSTTSAEITSSSIMEASEDASETTIPHVMKSTSKPAVTERVETKLSTLKTEPSRDISSTFMKDAVDVESTTKLASMSTITEESIVKEVSTTTITEEIVTTLSPLKETTSSEATLIETETTKKEVETTSTSPTSSSIKITEFDANATESLVSQKVTTMLPSDLTTIKITTDTATLPFSDTQTKSTFDASGLTESALVDSVTDTTIHKGETLTPASHKDDASTIASDLVMMKDQTVDKSTESTPLSTLLSTKVSVINEILITETSDAKKAHMTLIMEATEESATTTSISVDSVTDTTILKGETLIPAAHKDGASAIASDAVMLEDQTVDKSAESTPLPTLLSTKVSVINEILVTETSDVKKAHTTLITEATEESATTTSISADSVTDTTILKGETLIPAAHKDGASAIASDAVMLEDQTVDKSTESTPLPTLLSTKVSIIDEVLITEASDIKKAHTTFVTEATEETAILTDSAADTTIHKGETVTPIAHKDDASTIASDATMMKDQTVDKSSESTPLQTSLSTKVSVIDGILITETSDAKEARTTLVTEATKESAVTTSSEKETAVVTEVKSTFSETILSSLTPKSDEVSSIASAEVSSIASAETSTSSVSEIKSTTELFSNPESTELPSSSTDLTTEIVELPSTSEVGIASAGMPILSTTHAPEKTDGNVLVDDTKPTIIPTDKSTTLLEVEKLETVSEEILPEVISSSEQTPTMKSAFSEQTPSTKVTLSEEIQTEIATFSEESQTEKTTSSKLETPSSMDATTSKPLVETSTINALATDIMTEITLEEETSTIEVTDASKKVTMETPKEIQSVTNIPDITQTQATDKSSTSVTEMSTNIPTLHTSEETLLTETSSSVPSKVTTTLKSSSDAITQTTITKEKVTAETALPLSSEKSVISEKGITTAETSEASSTTKLIEAPSKSTDLPLDELQTMSTKTTDETKTEMTTDQSLKTIKSTLTTVEKIEISTSSPIVLSDESKIPTNEGESKAGVAEMLLHEMIEEQKTTESKEAVTTSFAEAERISEKETENIIKTSENLTTQHFVFDSTKTIENAFPSDGLTSNEIPQSSLITDISRESPTAGTSEESLTTDILKTSVTTSMPEERRGTEISKESSMTVISEESLMTDISKESTLPEVISQTTTVDSKISSSELPEIQTEGKTITRLTTEMEISDNKASATSESTALKESDKTTIALEDTTFIDKMLVTEPSFSTDITVSEIINATILTDATSPEVITVTDLFKSDREEEISSKLPSVNPDVTLKSTTTSPPSIVSQTRRSSISSNEQFATTTQASLIKEPTRHASSDITLDITETTTPGIETSSHEAEIATMFDINNKSFAQFPSRSRISTTSITIDEEASTTPLITTLRYDTSSIKKEPEIKKSTLSPTTRMIDLDNFTVVEMSTSSRNFSDLSITDEMQPVTLTSLQLETEISIVPKTVHALTDAAQSEFTTPSDGSTQSTSKEMHTTIQLTVMDENISSVSPQPLTTVTLSDMKLESLETEREETFASSTLPSSKFPDVTHGETTSTKVVSEVSERITEQIKEIGIKDKTGETASTTEKFSTVEITTVPSLEEIVTSDTEDAVKLTSIILTSETISLSDQQKFPESTTVESATKIGTKTTEIERKTEIERVTTQQTEKDKIEVSSSTTEDWTTPKHTTTQTIKEDKQTILGEQRKSTTVTSSISEASTTKVPTSELTTMEEPITPAGEAVSLEISTTFETVETSELTIKPVILDSSKTTTKSQTLSTSETTTKQDELVTSELTTEPVILDTSKSTTKSQTLSTSETTTKQDELVTSELTTEPAILDTSKSTTKSQTLSTPETATKQDELVTSELTTEPVILDTSKSTTKSQTLSTSETATKQDELVTSELTTEPAILDTSKSTTKSQTLSTRETATKQDELVTSELTTEPVILDTSKSTTKSQTLSTSETATKQDELVTSELTTEPAILDTSKSTTKSQTLSTRETATKQDELVTSELTTKPVLSVTSKATTKSQTLSAPETTTKPEKLVTSELTPKAEIAVITETSQTTDFLITEKEAVKITLAEMSTTERSATSIESQNTLEHRSMEGRTSTLSPVIASSESTENLWITETEKPETVEVSTLNTLTETSTLKMQTEKLLAVTDSELKEPVTTTGLPIPTTFKDESEKDAKITSPVTQQDGSSSAGLSEVTDAVESWTIADIKTENVFDDMSTVIATKDEVPLLVTTTTAKDHSSIITLLDDHKTISDEVSTMSKIDQTTALFKTEVPLTSTARDELIKTAVTSSETEQEETVTPEDIKRTTDEKTVVTAEIETEIATTEMPTKIEFSTAEGTASAEVITEKAISVPDISEADIRMKTTLLPEQTTRSKTTKLLPTTSEQKMSTTAMFRETENPITISSTADEMLEKSITDATRPTLLELATAETEIKITSVTSIPVTDKFSTENEVSISIHEDNKTTFAETHTAPTTSHSVTADKSTILPSAEAETLQSKTIVETDLDTERVTEITEIPALLTNESLTTIYDITSTKSSDAVSVSHEITSTPASTEHEPTSTDGTIKLKDAAMTTLLLSSTETDSESSLHTTTPSKTKSSAVTLSTSETASTSAIVSDATEMIPTVTTKKTEGTSELLSTPVSLTTLADATILTTETTDCVVNGVSYADGEGIATIDPCESCHCALGEIVCFRKICDAPSQGCVPRPGQEDRCCPVAFDCPIDRGNLEKTSTEAEANSTSATTIENKFSTIPSSTSGFMTTENPNRVDETKFTTLSSVELFTETGLVSEQTEKSNVGTSVQHESETFSSTEKTTATSFAETSSSPSTVKPALKSSSDIGETVKAERVPDLFENWKEKTSQLQNTTPLTENATKSFESTTEHQIITEEAIIGMHGFSSLPRISESSFAKDTTFTEQTIQSSERPKSTILSTEMTSLGSESEITAETTLKPKSTKPEDSVFTFVTTTRHRGSSVDVESFTMSTKQAESSSITTKEDEAIVDFKTTTERRGIHVMSSDADTIGISTVQDDGIISTESTSPVPQTDIVITEKIVSQPIIHNISNPVVTEKQENVTSTQMLTAKQENITSTQIRTTEDVSLIKGDVSTTTIVYVQASDLTTDPFLMDETTKVSTDELIMDEIVTMSVKSNELGGLTTEKQQEIPLSEVNMTTRIPTTTKVEGLKTSVIKAATETPLVTFTEKFLKVDKITEFKTEQLPTVSQTELTSEVAIKVSETLLTETSEIFPTLETTDIVTNDQTSKKPLTTEKSASEKTTNVEMSTMSSEDVTVQFSEETLTERTLPPMEISDILSTKESPEISEVLSTLEATKILTDSSTVKATEKFNILSTENAIEADTISTIKTANISHGPFIEIATKMTELPSTENTKEIFEAFSTEKVTEIFNELSTTKIPEVAEVSLFEQNINASDISAEKTAVPKTLSTLHVMETSTTERVVGTSEILPTESASKISGTASTESESETTRLSSMEISFETTTRKPMTTTIKIVPNTTVEREIVALTSTEKSSSGAVSTPETTEAFSERSITDVPKTTFAQKEEETISETTSTEIVTKSPSETLMPETSDMLKDSNSERITTEVPAFTEKEATKISIVEKVTEPESTSTTPELFNISEKFRQETPKASELISTAKSIDITDLTTLSSEKTTTLEKETSSMPTVLTEEITTRIADSVTEISEGNQPFKERTVEILESSTTESVATEQSEGSSATELPATEQSEKSSATELPATEQSEKSSATELPATEQSEESSATELPATEQSDESSATELPATEQSEKSSATELPATEQSEESSATELPATQQSEESSATELTATEQSEESSATELPATEPSEESSTEKVVTITATKTTRMFSIQPIPNEKHTNEISENVTTESDNEDLKLSTSKMTQGTTESAASAETTAEAFVTNGVGDEVLETKAFTTDTITENIFNETEHATGILTTEVAPNTEQKESKLFDDVITNEASVTSFLTSTRFIEKLPEVSTSSVEVTGETKDILWRHIGEEDKKDFERFTTEKSITNAAREVTGSQFTENSTEFEQTTISTQKESILMTERVKFSEPGFTVKGKRTTQRITTPDSVSITEKVTNLVTSVPMTKEAQTTITTATKIDIESVDSSATKSDLKSEFSGEPSEDFTDSDKLVPEILDFKTQNITEISVEETTETETPPFEISTKASTIPSSSKKIEAITDKLTTILISESSMPENFKEHAPVNTSDVVSESVITTSTITSPDFRFLPDLMLRKLTPSAEGIDVVDVSSVTTTSDFTTASTLSNQTISDATESKETVPPQTSATKDESKTTPSKSQRAEPIAEDVVSSFEFSTSSIGTSSPSSSTISSKEVVANDQPKADDQSSSSQATPTTDDSKVFSKLSNVTSKTSDWMPSTTEQITLNNTETTTVADDFFLDEGACIFEGRIYQSAEQIPRPDPCEFCFCFRSDVICLQQSCPPPLDACQATPMPGYCCPRFECPIYVTSRNLTKASQSLGNRKPVYIQRRDKREIDNQVEVTGCDVKGFFYEIGQTVKSASGPCLHCQCDLDGMMRCDPRKCKPEAPLMLKLNPSFFRRR